MIKIQLITAHGHQTDIELEDFRQAQSDDIARSAAKIISRLKAGGDKITRAQIALLEMQEYPSRGKKQENKSYENQLAEVAIISVDSLGFDLRVCCGTQIQTLRFAFNARATSEYSAERKLNDLLLPGSYQKPQKKKGSSK
ncbi:hypothetical protein CRYUN_Cryun19dG0083900 [Craigia yunnanensis]